MTKPEFEAFIERIREASLIILVKNDKRFALGADLQELIVFGLEKLVPLCDKDLE